MRWTCSLAALAAAVGLCAAQQPPTLPGESVRQTPTDLVGGAPADSPKVCVYEAKATKKTVYTTVCKEYCAPDYSPLAVLRRCFGHNGCDGPCPPEPLVKTVLVKKTVPGPDKMVCALKDVKDLPPACPPLVAPAHGSVVPLLPGSLPMPAK